MRKHFDFEKGEILNIDKPEGPTSFQVVRLVRKWTNVRKVGHAGTLDPMATGVLLVCTGPATKQVSRLMMLAKTYEGTVELGITTNTDDIEGEITARIPVPHISDSRLQAAVKIFTGEISQIPPMFSAIKKDGKRLYQLARKGIVLEREPRNVTIYRFDILAWRSPFLDIRVECSRGTYIRAIARDIGEHLGTCGTLKALRRISIGHYSVEESYTLNQLETIIASPHGHL